MWIVQLAEHLKDTIPEGPPLFGKDVMSDKPQRFFAAEIIREQIFGCFSQEVKFVHFTCLYFSFLFIAMFRFRRIHHAENIRLLFSREMKI